MKKSNIATLISFILLIAICIGIIFIRKIPPKNTQQETTTSEITTTENAVKETTDVTKSETDTITDVKVTETTTKKATTKPISAPSKNQNVKFNNVLFIGDSRTVGLFEYGKISGADFFASAGMSVYNIYDQKIAVPSVGKVTLEELLNNKKYDKIYLMLGINEAGYNVNQTIKKYQNLVTYVKDKQPDGKLIIQANLHVTNERSQKDKYGINNTNINGINSGIKNFADNKTIFYINPNILFDDSTGSLDVNKSGDSAHLYAKYYNEWSNWILKVTADI